MKEKTESINGRWVHRRRMAYTSLTCLVLFIPILLIWPKTLQTVEGIAMTLIAAFVGIVGAYTGLSTLDDLKNKSGDKDGS